MGGFYEIMPQCPPPTGSKSTIVRVLLTFLEVCKFTFGDRKVCSVRSWGVRGARHGSDIDPKVYHARARVHFEGEMSRDQRAFPLFPI